MIGSTTTVVAEPAGDVDLLALVDELVPPPSGGRLVATAMALGVVVAILLFVLVVVPGESFHDWRSTGDLAGEVRELHGPLGLRTEAAVTAIDGGRVFAWGGRGGCWCRDGAIYDPATDGWEMLPAAPEEGRFAAGAVWTGDEVVVWGGHSAGSAMFDFRHDGLAYRPDTHTWRTIPAAPFGLMSPRLVALPGGILVAGGGRQLVPSAVRSLWFDLSSETWTEVAAPVDVLSVTTADGVVLGAGPVADDASVRGTAPWAVSRFDPGSHAWGAPTAPIDADWMTAVPVGG